MLRVQKGRPGPMDFDPAAWDGSGDSDLDDEPVIHNGNSIKMYKFLPAPNLRLTGRSTRLNPADRVSGGDRVSRGMTFPLGRPKPAPGTDQEWDFHSYRFKLSSITSEQQMPSDSETARRNRARTTLGHQHFARYRTSFDSADHNSKSASGSKFRCLPPVGSEGDVTFDPDNTVSPAVIRDILESEGVNKKTINQVVREQSEKRTASFQAEDYFKRLTVPTSPSTRPTPISHRDDRKAEVRAENSAQRPEGLPVNRLSPVLSPRAGLSPPLSLWERSKSLDDDAVSNCGHRDLGSWRTQREERLRPWAADVSPRQSPRGSRSDLAQIGFEYGEKTKDKLDSYSLEIEKTKWLSELQLERTFYRKGATLPRLILVSSKVPKANQLEKVIKQDKHLLYVPYDYDLLSFDEILVKVKNAMQSYRWGCKAKSILIICQGGPGYLYLLRRKVVTPQKLGNPANRDLIDFWKALADCLTKMDPEGAAIHIMGCCLIGNRQGEELMSQLQRMVGANNIMVENPLEIAVKGNQTIGIYFDLRRYKIWRTSQRRSTNSLKFEYGDDGNQGDENSQKLPMINSTPEKISPTGLPKPH